MHPDLMKRVLLKYCFGNHDPDGFYYNICHRLVDGDIVFVSMNIYESKIQEKLKTNYIDFLRIEKNEKDDIVLIQLIIQNFLSNEYIPLTVKYIMKNELYNIERCESSIELSKILLNTINTYLTGLEQHLPLNI